MSILYVLCIYHTKKNPKKHNTAEIGSINTIPKFTA